MQVKEILDSDIIAVDLPGATKRDAIDVLSEMLLRAGYIDDVPKFEQDIFHRETLGKTGIGNLIAIPHGQSSSVARNGLAIGKFANEIPWESLDDQGVRVVCLFSVRASSKGNTEHLKMLAMLAGKLGRDEVVAQLIAATNISEIIDAFE